MTTQNKEDKFIDYRRRILPEQLDRARRRYIGLVREARRMEMRHLLTNQELYEVD